MCVTVSVPVYIPPGIKPGVGRRPLDLPLTKVVLWVERIHHLLAARRTTPGLSGLWTTPLGLDRNGGDRCDDDRGYNEEQ